MKGGSKFTDFLGRANAWLKQTKILSKVGGALVPMLPGKLGIIGRAALPLIQQAGYGRAARRARVSRRLSGRGIADTLRRAHAYAKQHRLVSRGLTMASRAMPKVAGLRQGADLARSLGYGRRTSRGSGISLAGGALRLAGAARY